jgi:hypothetical protein
MHPQLQAVSDEFTAAQRRLHALADAVPDARWAERPDPDRWSVGECVAHLNLTSQAYLPLIRRALADARGSGARAPGRYHRDPTGWLLWRMGGPPSRHRVRTSAPFVPTGDEPRLATLAEFDRLQAEQLECVREADGLPLGRVKITSPFDARISYNLYACFTILPRHQLRHIWQAEQVLERLRRAS